MGRFVTVTDGVQNSVFIGKDAVVFTPVDQVTISNELPGLLPQEPTIVEKIVEVEKVIYLDRFVEVSVPKIEYKEKIVYIDKPIEVIKQVEIPVVQEKIIEIPKLVFQPQIPSWVWVALVAEGLLAIICLLK